MADQHWPVEPAFLDRLFDILGQHVEGQMIHWRPGTIAEQIERNRCVAGGAERRDLRIPKPRGADDPLQEHDRNRRR